MNQVKRIARQRRLTQAIIAGKSKPPVKNGENFPNDKRGESLLDTNIAVQKSKNKEYAFYPSRNNYLRTKWKAEFRAAILGK